jgi:hypothetical protein
VQLGRALGDGTCFGGTCVSAIYFDPPSSSSLCLLSVATNKTCIKSLNLLFQTCLLPNGGLVTYDRYMGIVWDSQSETAGVLAAQLCVTSTGSLVIHSILHVLGDGSAVQGSQLWSSPIATAGLAQNQPILALLQNTGVLYVAGFSADSTPSNPAQLIIWSTACKCSPAT